jgi:hypothetical protein
MLLAVTGFQVISLHCSGHRSFFRTVGATGFFDELKESMKRSGRYRLNKDFFVNVPRLTFVSALLLPLHLWGLVLDRVHRTGAKIILVARKSPQVVNSNSRATNKKR